MPHEYTRQRQGRDFSLHDYLMNALAESRRDAENAAKADEKNKSLLGRLEQYKTEAERNAVPVDGHEPNERGRNLV
jgi:hypothetical protein